MEILTVPASRRPGGRGTMDDMGFWAKSYARRRGAGGRRRLLEWDEYTAVGTWAHQTKDMRGNPRE